jgi:hypothetical protein
VIGVVRYLFGTGVARLDIGIAVSPGCLRTGNWQNDFTDRGRTMAHGAPWRIFVVVPAVVVFLIVGPRPSGYFFPAVMFFGLSLNTIVDDVRRSCFLADSGVGVLCFAGTMESA